MKKRVLAAFLAATMITLSACGGGASGTGPAGEPSSPQEEAEQQGQEEQDPSQEPGNAPVTDVEAAGEDGPTVDNPQDTNEGPTATEGDINPDAVPGSEGNEADEENVWQIEGAGVLFTVPGSFEKTKGLILQAGGGETVEGSGVTYYSVSYLGMTEDEYYDFQVKLQANEVSEEEMAEARQHYRELFTVYSIDGNRTEKDLRDYLATAGLGDVKLEQLDQIEEYTFFFSDESSDTDLTQLGDYEEEYKALAADMATYKENISCVVPVKQEEE